MACQKTQQIIAKKPQQALVSLNQAFILVTHKVIQAMIYISETSSGIRLLHSSKPVQYYKNKEEPDKSLYEIKNAVEINGIPDYNDAIIILTMVKPSSYSSMYKPHTIKLNK